jgi:para-nitrobenzyl esterase
VTVRAVREVRTVHGVRVREVRGVREVREVPSYRHTRFATMRGMRRPRLPTLLVFLAILALGSRVPLAYGADRVATASGPVEGTRTANGVRTFRGIPFAAPPVRELRWKAPQPVKPWTEPLVADRFGPRCMQRPIYGDMSFRSSGVSEDCLYLNVWTPADRADAKLPVLVYFYGGGFNAGDGSEPRYDGESMARRGIVAVTANYRLTVFGFLAHAELSKESPYRASGNYGWLDQVAALQWVRANIAAFGGDPARVTIAGESAGSISVSALMASPLSRGLIAGAIGESGAMIAPTRQPIPLAEAEKDGETFAAAAGASSIAALRGMSSDELLAVTARPGLPRPNCVVDGYFMPKTVLDILAGGEQARVPLLAGWNSEERGVGALLAGAPPTPEHYAAAVTKAFGERAADVLKAYPASSEDEVKISGTALSGDQFIAFGTWKWIDAHARTGGAPVYRYYYTRPRPPMRPEMGNAIAGTAGGVIRGGEGARPAAPAGAVHSAEIEYVMGNLATNTVFAWTPDDYKVSETFQSFVANFVKTGNPNAPGLPSWPAVSGTQPAHVMQIDVESKAVPDTTRSRYELLESIYLAR